VLHTENTITIDAPFEIIFDLAAEVTSWPQLLPHYRFVREWDPLTPADRLGRRVVAMSAWRTGIPVSWTSTQEIDRDARQVRYHHLAGATRGMDVVWRFEVRSGAVDVTIDHYLESARWWFRLPGVEYIVGSLFVMHIADRTLRGIKHQAEVARAEVAT